MKKVVMFFICLICLSFMTLSFEAKAQLAVYDPAVHMTLLMNLPAQLAQLEAQAKSLETELKGFENGQYQWSNVSDTINQLGNTISQANGIGYSAQNEAQQFQHQFPGYTPPTDFNQQYQDNINSTMNTLNGVLKSLNMSAQDFTNEPSRIAALQGLVSSAVGQKEAIQASAQISTEIISQVQLLRQTVMAQSNAQTVYYANQVQSDASAAANIQAAIQADANTPSPSIGNSGNHLSVPNF